MVRQYLVVDNNEVDIERIDFDPFSVGDRYNTAMVTMQTTYEEARQIFNDNISWKYVVETISGNKVIREETDMSNYRLLSKIDDLNDGTIKVTMRKLSDLEKMIELHYGGAN